MELLELTQPLTKEKMYANIATGQCFWNPPQEKLIASQWWELFDTNTSKFYYYDPASETSVWQRPYNVEVISLAKLQFLDDDVIRRPEMKSATTQTCFSEVLNPDDSQSAKIESHSPVSESQKDPQNVNIANESGSVLSCFMPACDDQILSPSSSDWKQVNGEQLKGNAVEETNTITESLPVADLGDEKMIDFKRTESTDHQLESKFQVQVQTEKTVDSERTEGTEKKEEVQTVKVVESERTGLSVNQREYRNEGVQTAKMEDSGRIELSDNNQREYKNEGVQTAFDLDVRQDILNGVQLNPTPPMRRAFPRTNPAYVGSVVPHSGDRKYTRRGSTETGLAKSFRSSSSVKESSSVHGAKRATVQRIGSADHDETNNSSRSSTKFDERAIDCRLMEKNNNGSAFGQTSVSLTDLIGVCDPCSKVTEGDSPVEHPNLDHLFRQDRTTVCDSFADELRSNAVPKESIVQAFTNNDARVELRNPPKQPTIIITVEDSKTMAASPSVHRNMSSSDITRMYASVSSSTGFQTHTEQSLYRQKKGRFEERRIHRRQSSESDLAFLQSQDFTRRSALSYGSGSELSIFVDESIASSLNQHRIGLIRRKPVSVVNMLSWTKTASSKEKLLRHSDLYRLTWVIRACKIAPSRVALDVVCKGWSNSQLRDEIYMQLTRQLTDNPHEASMIRGWELVTVCLAIFPPSAKFQSYLEGFIARHIDQSQASVKRFALQCQQHFNRTTKHGARRGQKPPSLDEIEIALKSIYQPSMFGSTLGDIMQLQAIRFPERQLPWIQTELSEEILRLEGFRTEGIFRISGDIDEVNVLKTRCEKWIAPTGCSDAHTPVSLLKMWYRQLQQPLIPDDMYDDCVEMCSDIGSCIRLVDQLPAVNRLVFCYLIKFLKVFLSKENVAVTKMDLSNIAMIWAPNCLRCPSENPLVILESSRREMLFLRNVIENLDTDFVQGVN